jgi:hypothetical protein
MKKFLNNKEKGNKEKFWNKKRDTTHTNKERKNREKFSRKCNQEVTRELTVWNFTRNRKKTLE